MIQVQSNKYKHFEKIRYIISLSIMTNQNLEVIMSLSIENLSFSLIKHAFLIVRRESMIILCIYQKLMLYHIR